jgi:CHC2-type zinc finger protein
VTVTGLDHYARLFGPSQRPRDKTGTLDHQSLPTPARYLQDRGLLAGKLRGEWASIRCPVHKAGAEAHASLRVSLVDGHFRCMTCGARGGDVISLHRLLTGAGFVQAVRELGGHFHE